MTQDQLNAYQILVLQQMSPWAKFGLFCLILWAVVWKGLGMWHSARRGDHKWFIAIMIINTLGIFEMIYLFLFAKREIKNLFQK